MITVTNEIDNNMLVVKFSSSKEEKSININIENDVDFKPIVGYLVELIPLNENLTFNFAGETEVLNSNKNYLVTETLKEIYEKYNNVQSGSIIAEATIENSSDEDLPF